MADKNEPLPWDYFLTNYERDLILLPLEEAGLKYPLVSKKQLLDDIRALKEVNKGNVAISHPPNLMD